MESVKDTASWGALIGAILPFLIAVVNQPGWSKQQRQIIAVGVSVVAGVGTVLVSGNFDIQNWLVTIVAVIGAAQAAYALLWKPTGTAPAVEGATEFKKSESGQANLLYTVVMVLLVLIALVVLVRLL